MQIQCFACSSSTWLVTPSCTVIANIEFRLRLDDLMISSCYNPLFIARNWRTVHVGNTHNPLLYIVELNKNTMANSIVTNQCFLFYFALSARQESVTRRSPDFSRAQSKSIPALVHLVKTPLKGGRVAPAHCPQQVLSRGLDDVIRVLVRV